MRGFIDDTLPPKDLLRQCVMSQSAFMRGFIDDLNVIFATHHYLNVSIRVHARLHR